PRGTKRADPGASSSSDQSCGPQRCRDGAWSKSIGGTAAMVVAYRIVGSGAPVLGAMLQRLRPASWTTKVAFVAKGAATPPPRDRYTNTRDKMVGGRPSSRRRTSSQQPTSGKNDSMRGAKTVSPCAYRSLPRAAGTVRAL